MALAALAACATPHLAREGRNAPPPSPSEPWQPSAGAAARFTPAESSLAHFQEPARSRPSTALTSTMTLPDVIDAALERNPQTRATWADARAAAANVDIARAAFLPSLDAGVTGGPTRSVSQNNRVPNSRTTYNPQIALSYLLFDFGGRSGTIAAARQRLAAADFTHNSTIQQVVLQTEVAYFTYQANRQVRDAQDATVRVAQANLDAATQRREVGLATIADVLQARTALAQVRLDLQTYEGSTQAARAQLAASIGVRPTDPFDVVNDSTPPRTGDVAAAVDSLIDAAAASRPDLAAARALARSAQAEVRVARSQLLPAITVGANVGRTISNVNGLSGKTSGISLGVSLPIFPGLFAQYGVLSAREQAAAAVARAQNSQLLVAQQVYASYYDLRTSAQRVATSTELLDAATQSLEVAQGRYREGVGSILDLLTAQSALATARTQAVQARWTWYQSLAQLTYDVGALGPRGESPLPLTSGAPGGPR